MESIGCKLIDAIQLGKLKRCSSLSTPLPHKPFAFVLLCFLVCSGEFVSLEILEKYLYI